MLFKNRRIKPIISAFLLLLLITIASGFVWMRNSEGSRTRAKGGTTSISATCTDTSLMGYAWSENIGWISMSGTGYSVSVSQTDGKLSGYAWSENIGWINFAPTGPYPTPTDPLSNFSAKYDSNSGKIQGWASILKEDLSVLGWIKMSDDTQNYGVSLNPATGLLPGFAWSQDYGWIDFGGVTYECIAKVGGLAYSDGILVYTSAHRESVNNGDASVTSGENIIYSLEITNQGNAARAFNLKFDIPLGFTYSDSNFPVCVNTGSCPKPTKLNGLPTGTLTSDGTTRIYWNSFSVPVGESKISFTLKAP